MKDIDIEGLIKLLLAPAALFYAFGYVITRAYVTSTGLQASFWFTESFYREAGARFLLDIVVALALLPHVVIPLSVLFLTLLPGATPEQWRWRLAVLPRRLGLLRALLPREVVLFLTLLIAVAAIVFVLVDCGDHSCGTLLKAPKWLFTSDWLLASAQQNWLDNNPALFPMAIFLALAVPTTATLGLWAHKMVTRGQGTATETGDSSTMVAEPTATVTARVLTAFFVSSAFVVVTCYIPIAYGAYFYDFVVVRVVDAEKCAVRLAPKNERSSVQLDGPAHKSSVADAAIADEDESGSECYLLGRFDDARYILIGREKVDSHRKIYIKQVTGLEPFAIESRRSIPLRALELMHTMPEG